MIIDLSVPLDEKTPAYPGDPKVSIRKSAGFLQDGYLGHSIEMGTHSGTHIDAPAHMIEGARTLGQLPLETFAGPGKLVHSFSQYAISARGITAGDVVLFDTGTSERYYDVTYFTDYPVLTLEAADYLIRKKVKLVGLDTCSADNSRGFPVHKKLLAAGIPIIENLTGLAILKARAAGKNFRVYALPLKLNVDGAPVRAFAEVPDE